MREVSITVKDAGNLSKILQNHPNAEVTSLISEPGEDAWKVRFRVETPKYRRDDPVEIVDDFGKITDEEKDGIKDYLKERRDRGARFDQEA